MAALTPLTAPPSETLSFARDFYSPASPRFQGVAQKALSELVYSRNGLSAADKMDKQLALARKDRSGKEKSFEKAFVAEIPKKLPGRFIEYSRFSFAAQQILGGRAKQEDEFIPPTSVSFRCRGEEKRGLLCGVFDGHGDQQKAGRLMKKGLARILSERLEKHCEGADSVSEEIIGNALTETFDIAAKAHREKGGRGGATACCAFIFDNVVYCPNVGDSRMVLVTREAHYQVTEDARLENDKRELNDRFAKWHQRMGNEIVNFNTRFCNAGWRVCLGGNLNMGREVGIEKMCPRPKISRFFIGEREDGKLFCKPNEGLLFIFSDGLSAVATVKEVGRDARLLARKGASLQQIADAFVIESTNFKIKDNVTVLIVAL